MFLQTSNVGLLCGFLRSANFPRANAHCSIYIHTRSNTCILLSESQGLQQLGVHRLLVWMPFSLFQAHVQTLVLPSSRLHSPALRQPSSAGPPRAAAPSFAVLPPPLQTLSVSRPPLAEQEIAHHVNHGAVDACSTTRRQSKAKVVESCAQPPFYNGIHHPCARLARMARARHLHAFTTASTMRKLFFQEAVI
jgi:hypothetical protein